MSSVVHGDAGHQEPDAVCQADDAPTEPAAVGVDCDGPAYPRTEKPKEDSQYKQDESAPAWLGVSWADSWADVAMVALTLGLFFAALWIGHNQVQLMDGALGETKRATDAAVESAQIARRDFLLTQRPKISVRNVVVRVPQPTHGPPPLVFAPGHYVSGQLYIVNTGGTPAHIVDCGYVVYPRKGEWHPGPGIDSTALSSVTEALKHIEDIGTWSTELPMERPYEGKPGNVGPYETLASGESKPLPFQSDVPMGPEGDAIRTGHDGWALWVLGFIHYADDNEPPIVRKMAFCRQWAPGLDAFVTVENLDYEHAD